MSWQTIKEKYGVSMSEVLLSQIRERIDAEFYDPKYLSLDKAVSQKKWDYLGNLTKKIDVGYVGSMVSEYSDDGILLLQTRNVKEFFIDTDECQKINSSFHKKLKKSQVYKNDILIARSGSFGSSAVYLENEVINSADIIIIRSKEEISPSYLTTFINSKYGSFQLMRFASGGLQGHINLTILEELKIVLPTKEIEKSVQSLIVSAYEKMVVSKNKYKEAEQLLLKEINLVGYKPSEKNISVRSLTDCLANNRFDAEYWQPKYDELKRKLQVMGGIPLEKVFDLIGHPTQVGYSENGNIPVIAQKHLGPELTLKNTDFDNLTDQSLIKKADKKYLLKDEDILVCSAGAPGQTVLWREKYAKEAICGSFITVLRETDFIPEYVALYLASLPGQMQFQQYQTASVQQYVYPSQIKKILIPKIGMDIQKKLAEKILSSHEMKEEAKDLLEKAKRGIELFIEKDEKSALKYLEE